MKRLSTVMVACALATTGALAAPTAHAQTEAWNTGVAPLRLPSTSGEGPTCVSKKITLIRGEYRWRIYYRHVDLKDNIFWGPTRYIGLRAGEYTWRDCMISTNDGRPVGWVRGYQQRSQLFDPAGNEALNWTYAVAAYGTGLYDYGSGLLRVGDWN